MAKKDFQKRMGQIYALAIQHGINEEDLITYANQQFMFLYEKKRQHEIKKLIDQTNYTKDRYVKIS